MVEAAVLVREAGRMSYVNNYTIMANFNAIDIDALNGSEFVSGQRGMGFREVGREAGGMKNLEHELYSAAFNHVNEEDVMSAIHASVDMDEIIEGFVSVFVHRDQETSRYTIFHWNPIGWDEFIFDGPQE